MITVKSTQDTYDSLLQLMSQKKRLFYSRFGDGDIYIMMGRDQSNQTVSESLKMEMIESFSIEDPDFLKGIAVNHPNEKGMIVGLFARYPDNPEMVSFLHNQFPKTDNLCFENPVFLHYMSVFKPKQVNLFLEKVIRPKRKMFIGRIPKNKIETIVGPVDVYIETPAKNAYDTIDSWYPLIEKHIKEVDLVIPAAGMSTRVINKRLWESNVEVQSFDIGSIVDIANDFESRKWIRLAGHRVKRHIIINPKSSKHNSNQSNLNYILKEIKLQMYTLIKSKP
jgi:hypothetical protein